MNATVDRTDKEIVRLAAVKIKKKPSGIATWDFGGAE